MQFRDHLPPDCPPSDAISAVIEVYCLVSGDPPVENDFLSYDTHHTWWPNREIDSSTLFKVI
jgi:hypothetical protein